MKKPEEASLHLLLEALEQCLGGRARTTFTWACRNLFRQLSKDENPHGSGMSRATKTPQNHPSGHIGGLVMPWWVAEMLDGERQTVDISAHARTADNSLPRKRLEEDLCGIFCLVPPPPPDCFGHWTGLNQSKLGLMGQDLMSSVDSDTIPLATLTLKIKVTFET